MRYIEKIKIENIHNHLEIKLLLDYINVERNTKGQPRHPNFDGMKSDNKGKTQKALRKQLCQEQYNLCCFCQEQVSTNYLIEHFVPQSKFKNEEVDYYNLFLCCNSKGQCSDAKADKLIGKFLTHPECAVFFKYNWNGEILPNCNYTLWEGDAEKGCKENLQKLNPMQLQAYITIEILGLNRQPLLARRVNQLKDASFQKILGQNKKNPDYLDWLKEEQSKYLPQKYTKSLPEFSNMFLYFINEQITNRIGKAKI